LELDLFLFVYVTAGVFVFYLLHGKARAGWLACWSMLFVAHLDKKAFAAALISAVMVWAAGKLTQRLLYSGRRGAAKLTVTAGIAVLAGTLIFMKYVPQALSGTPFQEGWNARLRYLLVPVGFSFYSFQAISYLSDLYQGKIKAAARFLDFLLYMLWFPKFISGPIERADEFLPQSGMLDQVRFKDSGRWTRACMYLLYGLVMKYVAADRIAGMVEGPFADPGAYSTGMLTTAAVLYTVQIYCDFAGYSYAAIGLSLMFGIQLRDNFMQPYLATNITQFWRRWHMSLSSWLRDYIYIPLGGNRKGFARKLLNLSAVFVICGLWHGSSLNFFVWGVMHAAFSVADNILQKYEKKHENGGAVHLLRSGITGQILTLFLVAAAWIVFRVPSMETALVFFRRMTSMSAGASSFAEELARTGLTGWEMWILIISVLLIIATDIYSEKKGKCFPELLAGTSLVRRCWFVYFAVMALFIFGMYGLGAENRLIYMQF